MSTAQEILKEKVDAFIVSVEKRFVAAMDHAEENALRQVTLDALYQLAENFGTSDYGFNLVLEHFVERFCDLITDYLPGILSSLMPKHAAFVSRSTDTDVAFVSYYALSLIYKKEDCQVLLRSLIDERYNFFTQLYPLAFEVRSRYYKRIHEYDNALEADELAIDFLKVKDITNYALCISYASTVCRMYEKGYTVENYQKDNAWLYIQNAISYNPQYPKYHFLKGKLHFYANRGMQDIEAFQICCSEAISCIKHARSLQMEQPGAHFNAALQEYNKLMTLITQESRKRTDQSLPFIHLSEQELRQSIEKVLTANDKKECPPPNPNLKPGQKFVFISYSHLDFKSVYCDLWTLYAKKVPFQYDGGMPAGIRWDAEVHNYINREECVGVIFFISPHTLLSEAIEIECKLAREAQKSGKRYYCVNLAGDTVPSQILMQSIIANGVEGCNAANVDDERIKNFLNTFHDKAIFLAKRPELGPNGQAHIPELLSSLKTVFPELEYNSTPLVGII